MLTPASAQPQPCSAASIMSTLVLSMINISLKEERRAPRQCLQDTYDFIVVGGGSAGCVLASRLSENPRWSVLLLEAGGEQPPETKVPGWTAYLSQSPLSWGWTSQPQENGACRNGCAVVRGKGLGGGSAINSMLYVRGNHLDYDNWSVPGWTFEELLPFFKKAENNRNAAIANNTKYHATGGPLSVQWQLFQDRNVAIVSKAMEELGFPRLDVNGPSQLGQAVYQSTVNGKMRASSYSAYLDPVRSARGNLCVRTRTLVTRVLFQGKQTHGVVYRDERGAQHTVWVRKEVILSGGTYGSAQLLMLSGVGPADHLNELKIPVIADLPVGENLQDHVLATGVYYKLGRSATEPASLFDYLAAMLAYRQGRGPLTNIGLSQLGAFRRSPLQKSSDPRPNIQMVFSGFSAELHTQAPGCPQAVDSGLYYSLVGAMPVLLHPRSRGRIRLNSTDPMRRPLIQFNALQDEADEEELGEALEFGTLLARTATFQEYGIELVPPQIPAECQGLAHLDESAKWRCLARTSAFTVYHAVGTCSIGSVVDSHLAVRYVRGLRVADASIIPRSPSGNTNAPTIMVAEKAACLIRMQWERGDQELGPEQHCYENNNSV